jgi:adenylylsulfate kinase
MSEKNQIYRHDFGVSARQREAMMGHKPLVIWMSGLSGSGKSTIANLVEQKLFGAGVHTCILDGDNTRSGLCSDLGFDMPSRSENIRRVAETASILSNSGLVVLVSLISPLRKDREKARNIIGASIFREIYIKASIDICIQRDVKGLYDKAIQGEIKDFTGISSPYEPPESPDMVLHTESKGAEECADQLFQWIIKIIKS